MNGKPFFPGPGDTALSLSEDDSEALSRLKATFSSCSSVRPSSNAFREHLSSILHFVERRPEDRELRAHSVGLIQIPPFLCVSTHVLATLMHRSKSSINESFQLLGCASLPSKASAASEGRLHDFFQYSSSRVWSVRDGRAVLTSEPVWEDSFELPNDPFDLSYPIAF